MAESKVLRRINLNTECILIKWKYKNIDLYKSYFGDLAINELSHAKYLHLIDLVLHDYSKFD